MDTCPSSGTSSRACNLALVSADTTHAGKMIMTIFAGIAEFERDLIIERTGAGREAARIRGVRSGRPRSLSLV
ncbi:MAG: recombinase family protein [Verrucomicrobia bacterium]|nr:recombinase family protein [Verrucomicrobiota bacterium]